MKYGVKWVNDNLGISRDTIRYYERKGLIPEDSFRASHGESDYREFDDEGIELLWQIRTLQGIGYTAKEIKAMIDLGDTSALKNTIAEKIDELEIKKSEIEGCLVLAKAIKSSGMLPVPKELGNMKFDDFIIKAKNEWSEIFTEGIELSENTEVTSKLKDQFIGSIGDMVSDNFLVMLQLESYFKALSALNGYDYRDGPVQTLVSLLYSVFRILPGFEDFNDETVLDGFSRLLGSMILDGDMFSSMDNEGIDREFIGKAILYHGGYECE